MKQLDKKQLLFWDKYRKSLITGTPVSRMSFGEISSHKQALEKDIVAWCNFFFPTYASAPFAPFHIKFLKRTISTPEYYDVLSWSRELSKSTTVMFAVLFLVLTGKKKNILLTSNSFDNAVRLLEPYRANLDSNQRIIQYYGQQNSLGHWDSGEFITKNGCAFRALGAGQSPRGSRNENVRPDLIICDDFDTDEDCRNPETIKKKWDWFEQALYATRSIDKPLNVIWCGNIIAKDCCITRAGQKADNWDIINIRDKHSRSSWPEKNSEAHIDRVLSKISTRSAQQEYFNNPLAEGDVFKEIYFEKIPSLNSFKFLLIYGDPGTTNSSSKKSSTKSVALLGFLKGVYYIIDLRVDHVSNQQFVQWYFDLASLVPSNVQLYCYIENNSLQDPFFEQVIKPLFANISNTSPLLLSLQGDSRKKPDKFQRIEGNLSPLNTSGHLIFNEKKKDNEHFIRAKEQFLLLSPTMRSPADCPDCIEGAVWKIKEKLHTFSDSAMIIRRRPINKKRI
ncbi:MAG: hypothetical protein SPK52_02100 [Synergistales bacterium]|nr:hypothetical protein [Bacteroidales bacterium]MDY6434989.1 hypothetical protein [Synergistales bacterium]MDY6393411.1 hypothetical protein [Bacteroidales bacterium]MDY6395345.1 hypothetical protein [Bacteroidales bacterium]MDY6402856.1 hypothetical protein [Bacteroidales bacterium]